MSPVASIIRAPLGRASGKCCQPSACARWLCAILAIAAIGCGETTPPAGRSLHVAATSEPWPVGHVSGQVLATEHYRIYTTVKREDLLRILPGFVEAAHEDYQRATGLGPIAPDQPLPLYMLGSRAEWGHLTTSLFGPDSDPERLIDTGAYTYRGVTVCWDIGGLATLAVASHEGMHQFLSRHLRTRIPLWVEEGLATGAEGFAISGGRVRFDAPNVLRRPNLASALTDGHWLPIEQLLTADMTTVAPGRPGAGVAFYGQIWALGRFLQSRPHYAQGLQRMLADASAGRLRFGSPPRPGVPWNRAVSLPVFQAYITRDLENFEEEFHSYCLALAGLR